MSMRNPMAGAVDTGQAVVSVRDYEAAQKVVSQLIAGEVPARDIAIVGMGVRTIERVTGRLGYATAARSGAVNGVLIGLFLSAIMVLGNPEVPIQLFVGFVLIGVALGMMLSILTFWMVRRRRDYASVMQLAADHYEVTVLAASLAKARQVLGTPAERAAPAPVDLSVPPRYGERVVPEGAPPASAAEQQVPAGEQPVAEPSPRDDQPDVPPAPQYGERIDPEGTDEPR